MEDGIRALFRVKRRHWRKAIPLLLADIDEVTAVTRQAPQIAWDLARRFWPGALTIVLPKSEMVPDVLTAGTPSVAVRVPDHPVVAQLVRSAGAPLAATSANVSGELEATSAEAVLAALGSNVGLILDGGRSAGGVPSTVVDCTCRPPKVLRRGTLASEVEEVLLSKRASE
jgi:L-threonylcarbamoyladenylate synthase